MDTSICSRSLSTYVHIYPSKCTVSSYFAHDYTIRFSFSSVSPRIPRKRISNGKSPSSSIQLLTNGIMYKERTRGRSRTIKAVSR